MDFSLSLETRMIVDTVRRFVDERLIPVEADVDERGVMSAELVSELKSEAKSLGLFAMNMPPEFGGGGLGHLEMCLVEEQFGRTIDSLIRRTFGQVYPMLLACQGSQVDEYLRPTVAGDKICAMAITEPEAGSDAASISTTAERRGNG